MNNWAQISFTYRSINTPNSTTTNNYGKTSFFGTMTLP
jgi:hypothetical protein